MQGNVAESVKDTINSNKVAELTELLHELCEHTEKEYYLPSSLVKWRKENKVENKYSKVAELIMFMIAEILNYKQAYHNNNDNYEVAKELLEDVRSNITDINAIAYNTTGIK